MMSSGVRQHEQDSDDWDWNDLEIPEDGLVLSPSGPPKTLAASAPASAVAPQNDLVVSDLTTEDLFLDDAFIDAPTHPYQVTDGQGPMQTPLGSAQLGHGKGYASADVPSPKLSQSTSTTLHIEDLHLTPAQCVAKAPDDIQEAFRLDDATKPLQAIKQFDASAFELARPIASTIAPPNVRQIPPAAVCPKPPSPNGGWHDNDDDDADFDLPQGFTTLKLAVRPAPQVTATSDDDIDWAELGGPAESPTLSSAAADPSNAAAVANETIDGQSGPRDPPLTLHLTHSPSSGGISSLLCTQIHESTCKRAFSSPTPSCTPSLLASENDDDLFDEIEFPSSMDTLTLTGSFSQRNGAGMGDRREAHQSGDPSHMFSDDSGIDPDMSLIIPTDINPFVSINGVYAIQAKPAQPIQSLPAKSPLTPSLASRPTSSASVVRSPSPSKIPRLTTKVMISSPSMEHFQRLSSHLLRQRILNIGTANADPKNLSTTSLAQLYGEQVSIQMMRSPKSHQDFGDGTELDNFEDLYAAPPRSSNGSTGDAIVAGFSGLGPSRIIKNAVESARPATRELGMTGLSSPSTRLQPQVHKKGKKRPNLKLIQNLNTDAASKVIGDTGEMTYNPVLQKWEGNERILKDFEQGLPVRPALITNIGGNKVAQIVGNMVFDPVKMTWNRIKSQDNAATADDDDDIFKDFGDCLTVPDEKSQPLRTEFELPKSVVEGFYISESSHKLFMGNWYPRALSSSSRSVGRDNISKTHLYDIRTVCGLPELMAMIKSKRAYTSLGSG